MINSAIIEEPVIENITGRNLGLRGTKNPSNIEITRAVTSHFPVGTLWYLIERTQVADELFAVAQLHQHALVDSVDQRGAHRVLDKGLVQQRPGGMGGTGPERTAGESFGSAVIDTSERDKKHEVLVTSRSQKKREQSNKHRETNTRSTRREARKTGGG